MNKKSLTVSAYVIFLGLVACPLQLTGQEIAKFSLGTVSDAVNGQKRETSRAATASQPQKESTATRTARREAKVSGIRETYDPVLETHMTAAQPAGFLSRMIGDAGVKMIGAWSGSSAECATSRLLFFENANARQTVAWWTQPLSLRGGGLIPSLTGEWEVRDNAVIMSFDETTMIEPFTDSSVSTRPTDISVRFEIVHDEEGKLLLRAPDGNLTLAAAELLEGSSEKWFVRCVDAS